MGLEYNNNFQDRRNFVRDDVWKINRKHSKQNYKKIIVTSHNITEIIINNRMNIHNRR